MGKLSYARKLVTVARPFVRSLSMTLPLAVIVAVCAVPAFSSAQAAPQQPILTVGEDYEDVAALLVKPEGSWAAGDLEALLRRFATENGITVDNLEAAHEGRFYLNFKHRVTRSKASAVAEQLRLTRRFATVELIHAAYQTSLPNDPDYNDNVSGWEVREYEANGTRGDLAYDILGGTRRTALVSVIDTGSIPDSDVHPPAYEGWDFYSSRAEASDPGDWRPGGRTDPCGKSARANTWHGLKMTALVAAITNNSKGMSSMGSWPSKGLTPAWFPVRVSGQCDSDMRKLAYAIRWSVGQQVNSAPSHTWRARVMNISFSTNPDTGPCDSETQSAINQARFYNAAVVVSAGNNDGADVAGISPANCAGVIVVTAHDEHGKRAAFANKGANVTISAPGTWIRSRENTATDLPYTFGQFRSTAISGTSPAAALVSVTVARMMGNKPTLKPDDVATILKDTARPFPESCPGCGTGMLDAYAAINASVDPIPTTVTVSPQNQTLFWGQIACGGLVSTVFDQNGIVMPNALVTYSTTTPNQLSVYSTGARTGQACAKGLGVGKVVATVGDASGTASVNVIQKPTCPPTCGKKAMH